MSEDNKKSIVKRLSEIKKSFVNNKSSEEKNLCTLKKFVIFNILILIFLLILIILYKEIIFDLVAKVLSSLIAVAGVFAGFSYNKREKYKEIVTKERINWLHKMQDNLSEYLKLTKSIPEKNIEKIVNEKAKLLIEEKKDKINKLYYEIIFNINHENDKDAYNTIKTYNSLVFGELDKITPSLVLTEDIKLELQALPGDEDELLLIIKDESERKKLIDLIKNEELENILTAEDKDKNKDEDIDEKELPKEISLLREEVSEEFTEIFREVWTRVKKEAD
ncbi:MAG: hypothetical protein E6084_03225 [Peptoniphilus harei]|nr:hypothetical protein [Peptoniphilus harei]